MDGDNTNKTAIIAIYLPIIIWGVEGNGYSDEAERLINELLSLSGKIKYPVDDDLQFLFEFAELNESDFKQFNIYQSASDLIPRRYLKISSKFKYKLLSLHDQHGNTASFSDEQLVSITSEHYIAIFEKSIIDLIIALNIASPGVIRTLNGVISLDGNKHKFFKQINNYLWEASQQARNIGWPTISSLNFLDVWKWLLSVPGFIDGFGKGKTGRALAAFSYLFSKSDNFFERMIWSIIGLESLYGESSISIRKQLLDKTEVVIGSRAKYKKNIGKMYDLRSRYLHGDVDFPARHFIFDAMSEYEQFLRDISNAEATFSAVLVATLQEMIKRNIYELTFKLSLA